MSRAFRVLAMVLALGACGGPPTGPSTGATSDPFVVVGAAGELAPGLDLFVDTDRGQRDWLSTTSEGLRAAYPSGQQWGFVGAVLLGPTAPGSRPGRNLSGYRTLQLELRGAAGGEGVEIGIKDNTDPDSGIETRKAVVLSTNWQTVTYPLADFSTADLTRVYLLFEVVLNGPAGRTVFLRNVRYLPN